MVEGWDNCTDGRRTNWRRKTMRVEEWEKKKTKWGQKKIFCWKEQFLSDNRSSFQRQSSGMENCRSSRKSWITCPKRENKYMAKKKAHKLESSMRGGQSITFLPSENVSRLFWYLKVSRKKVSQIPTHLGDKASCNVKFPVWVLSLVCFPDFVPIS